jgi:hypothetical protein
MLGLAALVTALSACGSAESPSSLLEITPDSPEVAPGDNVQFTATTPAAPDEPIAWAVVEPAGGTIDRGGVYTAPGDEGTYTVTASLTSLSTTQATQVRVKRNIRVDVSPTTATLEAGESLALTATATGSVKTVTWSVAEGTAGGAITAAGVYTAPGTAGLYNVVATSTADPTKSGSAAITVTAAAPVPAPTPVSVAVSPQTASVIAGNTVQFTATVTGSTNTGVTWSVAESGGGAVSASGLYTAPGTAGTYHVLATSQADVSKTTGTTVTVTAAPTPTPTPSGVGTGTSYTASYITGVTGAGTMPSWTTNVVTAACAGNGVTDDTSCLRAAAISARDQNKPLVIPATSSFYRITGLITIYTSVGGAGGMPTIKQTNTAGDMSAVALRLAAGMTGWVYNLHLIGTHNGTNATGEWAHNIDVGSVNGVTIKGNLLENAMGDSIGSDISAFDGGSTSSNVIIDSNTLKNPRRCGIAFVKNQRNWVITNNIIDKQVNYVSAVDFEPESGGTVLNVEVSYNKFVMNNRTPENPIRGSDGKAVSGWQVSATPNPGGNYYLHHNYGTFGTGYSTFGGWNWGYIYQSTNVESASVPN